MLKIKQCDRWLPKIGSKNDIESQIRHVSSNFFLSEPVTFRRVNGLESYSRTSGESNRHRKSVSTTRVMPYQLHHEDDFRGHNSVSKIYQFELPKTNCLPDNLSVSRAAIFPKPAIEAIRGSARPGEATPWTQNKARLTGTRNCNTIVEAQQAELEIVTGLPR